MFLLCSFFYLLYPLNINTQLVQVLALKGIWALVLANKAKDETDRKNVASKLLSGPKSRVPNESGGPVNADGTQRTLVQLHLDARKMVRLDKLW